jgi:nitrous oxidase accessory protein NosD
MRRTIVLLATMALTVLVATGVVLGAGIGSAGAQSSAVGPGESIQKAINAADPGDTMVVRGVHREDVIIRKDGIKLRGEDAVIEAPPRAKADSPCSRLLGPEGVCVLGDENIKTLKLEGQRVSDVSVSGFTFRDFNKGKGGGNCAIDVAYARNATITGNRLVGNVACGIVDFRSVNSTVAKNHVIGSPKTSASGILVAEARNTTVVKNVVKSIPEGENAIEAFDSIDTTIAGNDLIGNGAGVGVIDSTGTKILSNDVSRSGIVGTFVIGQKSANAKVVGNNISGGPWGMHVADTHRGSIAGNTIHDNCAGMFFEAFKAEPVGGFEVRGNTVEDNTRSCRATQSGVIDRNFSGIGIALLGARGMELTGNQISGNVPSGPTPVSGGVVVSTNPFYGGSAKPKPRNNSVIGNHFGRNKPDIFWDESGSGNRFLGNLCNTSVPSSLCNKGGSPVHQEGPAPAGLSLTATLSS